MIRLGLWMTRGVGFSEWKRTGLLDREVALYKALPGVETLFFHDESSEAEHEGMRFHPKTKAMGMKLDLMKSNQIDGAEVGLRVARKMKIPFILRCGYSFALFQQKRPIRRIEKWWAFVKEGLVARSADLCVVASRADQTLFVGRHGVPGERVRLRPNWVDTALWNPGLRPVRTADSPMIVSVGRLVEQKNQRLLIEAAARVAGAKVLLVGEGPMQEGLEVLARGLKVPCEIRPPMSHAELARVVAGARVFALTSEYEGLPKSLLEAMALGLPVVSTKVEGALEVIEDGKTGFLADAHPEAFAAALRKALEPGAVEVGKAASAHIQAHHSLERARQLELEMYREVLG